MLCKQFSKFITPLLLIKLRRRAQRAYIQNCRLDNWHEIPLKTVNFQDQRSRKLVLFLPD